MTRTEIRIVAIQMRRLRADLRRRIKGPSIRCGIRAAGNPAIRPALLK